MAQTIQFIHIHSPKRGAGMTLTAVNTASSNTRIWSLLLSSSSQSTTIEAYETADEATHYEKIPNSRVKRPCGEVIKKNGKLYQSFGIDPNNPCAVLSKLVRAFPSFKIDLANNLFPKRTFDIALHELQGTGFCLWHANLDRSRQESVGFAEYGLPQIRNAVVSVHRDTLTFPAAILGDGNTPFPAIGSMTLTMQLERKLKAKKFIWAAKLAEDESALEYLEKQIEEKGAFDLPSVARYLAATYGGLDVQVLKEPWREMKILSEVLNEARE